MPDLPNAHAISVLILTVVALFLFSRDNIRLETSSLLVLVFLTMGFELFPYNTTETGIDAVSFFYGFGHEALIAVCALMVVGQGIVRTGALDAVGRSLAQLWLPAPKLTFLLTLLLAAFLSAFVNNTPVVVLLLPILIGVSLRVGSSASSILMPMGLATLVGGMATTIGTSTNLLVVSVAADLGLERFSMFDFFLPAVIAGSSGILFLWFVAPKILPDRPQVLADTSPRIFSASLAIPAKSFADGKQLSEVIKRTENNMSVLRIVRGESELIPLPDVKIRSGDVLHVQDTPTALKDYETLLQAELYSGGRAVDDEHPLQADDQQLAEMIVVQGSPLVNHTLNQVNFIERYQLVTLALHKAGANRRLLKADIANVRLHIGDILLVQGAREKLASMKREGDMLVLDATTDLPTTEKAGHALMIMAGVILLAATGTLSIAISATLGALVMIVTGVLAWRDVSNALSTPVIMIVVVSLALGLALTKTGATMFLADIYLYLMAGMSPGMILSGLILLMAVLTNIVSNNAAAVIGTPIAISIADGLNLPAEAFVLAVLFGANMSYATPMAYKTNLLVMNAGNYTFGDFLRVGIPLTLIMWIILSWLLPAMYGF
jgi:di/tricarboxylate transporter